MSDSNVKQNFPEKAVREYSAIRSPGTSINHPAGIVDVKGPTDVRQTVQSLS